MLMEKVERKQLEVVAMFIDKGNPKWELDYLLVDAENMVATHTRAIGIVKHKAILEDQKSFLVHGNIVRLALSQRKAFYFELHEQKIICFDRDHGEIITISVTNNPRGFKDYKFPDYCRIAPETFKKDFPFVEHAQMQGIFAIERIQINNDYIPKKMNEGRIFINEWDLPVQITNLDDSDIKVIIMPIVDTFKNL